MLGQSRERQAPLPPMLTVDTCHFHTRAHVALLCFRVMSSRSGGILSLRANDNVEKLHALLHKHTDHVFAEHLLVPALCGGVSGALSPLLLIPVLGPESTAGPWALWPDLLPHPPTWPSQGQLASSS